MIVSHIFAATEYLDPMRSTDLYQYVVAANGIFLRAERPDLHVLIWLDSTHQPIRGLAPLSPYVRLGCSKVPARMTARMVELAYRARGSEILFYLDAAPWRLVVPEQEATSVTVRPSNPYDGDGVLIEVHSHHVMAPFFSSMDDRDELGFRIYAVLGNLLSAPMIHVRVGVYGHFYDLPAGLVFDLPIGVVDAYYLPRSSYGD